VLIFPAGKYSPGHASQFVGDCDHDFVARCTLHQPMNPLPESSGVVLDPKQHCTSTVDQHATQIDVAALADAEQFLFSPGGVLPWHHTHPCALLMQPGEWWSCPDRCQPMQCS